MKAAASILRAELYGITIPDWASNSNKLVEIADKLVLPCSRIYR
jgi:ubiquitin-activating enzyme E1